MRFGWLLLFAAGCVAGKPAVDEDFTELGQLDQKSDAFSSKMRLLGALDEGQTRKVYYTSSPRYRAYTLDGGGAIDLWVRSETGDALAWVLDSRFRVLAKNDDADETTYDAHLALTLPDHQSHYLVMRDYDYSRGWFSVTRAAVDPLACDGDG